MAQEADVSPERAAVDEAPGLDETRMRILCAAEERFTRYGFGKTTMAEIAADCGMSAGNLYRFFDNKVDIAATSASHWLAALEGALWAIARDGALPAGERLRRIVHTKLDALTELVAAKPHLEELIDQVCRERETVIWDHLATMRALLGSVIGDGKAAGEFDIDDPAAAAEAVQISTVGLFHHHVLWTVPADKLRADADKLVGLMVRGLAKR